LVFLLNQCVIFFLTCINLAISEDFIPRVLLLYRLNLTLFHVIIYNHSFFLEVDYHFSYLLFCGQKFVSFPLLAHFKHSHLVYMVILIIVNFSWIDALGFVLHKSYTSIHNFFILVCVYLCCLLADLFYPFYESIVISIGIIWNDSHSSIHLYNLLPMWHFPRSIVLYRFELKGIMIPSL
jgi:hypothetical protein